MYIMTNSRRTVLYIGVTNDLERRVLEHKANSIKGFTATYNCTDLLYFEEVRSVEAAIVREKQLKGWRRSKKEQLIEGLNPGRRDLSTGLVPVTPSNVEEFRGQSLGVRDPSTGSG